MGKVNFVFDSYYRYSGNDNNPKFVIPHTGIRASSCYIKSLIIPHSFYNINVNNNKIEFEDSLGAYKEVSIPVGDYTMAELLTALGAGMTTAATDGLTYTATIDDKTRKVTITNSGPTAFEILTNSAGKNWLVELLGFYKPYAEDQFFGNANRVKSLQLTSSTYVSDESADICVRNLYIRSSLAKTSRDYDGTALTFDNYIETGVNDIVATIPVNSAYGEKITWEPGYEPIRIPLHNTQHGITEVTFELVGNDRYLPLDLNGRSWVIEVVFENGN